VLILRRLAWLAGAVLLGALGSGLWDLFLKDALFWLGTKSLAVATFGFQRIRDTAYIEAAKGHREIPSTVVLFCVITTPLAAVLALLRPA